MMRRAGLDGRVAIALVLALALAGCRRDVPERLSARPAKLAVPSSSAEAPSSGAAEVAAPLPPPHGRAQGCPRKLKRPLLPSEIPALLDAPDVSELIAAGASGIPRRVRLRFHHPIAGCDCPSFALTDGASTPYVTFPAGVPNGHRYEPSKYVGFTQYEVTGYFSGRMLDYYDWLEAISGESDQQPIGGEEEEYRREEHPEFCVEHWCYRADLDPVLFKDVKSAAELARDRTEYRRILSEMAHDGAKRCPPPRRGEKGSARDEPSRPEDE